MAKRLLVLGGSGFVGKAICREAVQRGWNVTSLSRSGAPADIVHDRLLNSVRWSTGDALEAFIYPALVSAQDYVIHSIGILFESNPLSRPFQGPSGEYRRSHRALIRDTAEIAARESARAGVKAFGYISAARFGPLSAAMLPEYVRMKEEAEDLLRRRSARGDLRTVIARPGLMYGSDRALSFPLSLGVSIMSLFTAGLFPKALSVDTVAKAMLNEISRDATSPTDSVTLEVADMVRIAAKH